jgi:hypothetical protein
VIRKFVAANLLFALIAPLIAFDRAPLMCVMGGGTSMVAHTDLHQMHHATATHGADTHSSGNTGAHTSCVCPWECGASRSPADVVHNSLALHRSPARELSRFVAATDPVSADDKWLPPTTGPPGSLRS